MFVALSVENTSELGKSAPAEIKLAAAEQSAPHANEAGALVCAAFCARQHPASILRGKWSERGDLNSRPPVPQGGNYCFSSVALSLRVPLRPF